MTTTADSARSLPRKVQRRLHAVHEEYGESQPLAGYAGAMSVYLAGSGVLALVGRRLGARIPDRFGWSDTALVSIATFRLARLAAKDPITSPIRAPFTTFEGRAGDA